ncbi:hypothetical protein MBRA1_001601 [Malassezia brasiliensis]|uniref:Uncharacterized protein n=1 Tax=Malassezia brasiliensis TaxID=1821822 RepID=A0AAF0DRZ1_9BASI|nr:hypothetical protein MBRA1_001601 [Malassezia brasiliensis]
MYPECEDYQAVVDAALTEIGPPSADAELYLCGYSAGALHFFQRALEQMARSCAEGDTRALLVTTTRDQFTSASKYASWVESLTTPNLTVRSLDEDHFFLTKSALDALTNVLDAWWTDLHPC